jgi:hypothetical protein
MNGSETGEVECYSGYTYAEEPRTFVWQGQRHTVAHVERRWRTPSGPVFRICTSNNRYFTLAYDEAADTWNVQPVHRASEEMA